MVSVIDSKSYTKEKKHREDILNIFRKEDIYMGKKDRRHSSSASRRRSSNVVPLDYHDHQARIEGPKKKKWSIHDLRPIRPMTENQSDLFQLWFEGHDIFAKGCAGVGKTFLGLYLAFTELLERGEHQRVIIIRSAVAGRDIGFLPGTLEEKTAVFEQPYKDICQELFGKASTYQDMKDSKIVEFMTTSHVRGLTWDNSIIVVDEVQNMSFHEIDSIMSRVGQNTRIILCGDDKKQCDLKKHEVSGVSTLIHAIQKIKDFSIIDFTFDDIVRSNFVKNWIKATSDL